MAEKQRDKLEQTKGEITLGEVKGACHLIRQTHQDGVDHCVSDYKRLHLEGFTECSCLVHSPHSGCFICVDVLSQLLPVEVPGFSTIYSVAPSLTSLP